MRKVIKTICILLFLGINGGCSDTTIIHQIYSDVNGSGDSIIDFRNYTEFQWDKAYLFTYIVKQKDVEVVIGRNLPKKEEAISPLVFMYGDSIVYYEHNAIETFPDDAKARRKERIAIDNSTGRILSAGHGAIKFTPKDCVFKARKSDIENLIVLSK